MALIFVCNTISLKDGSVTERNVLMKNEDYCFAPIQERNPQFIPPSDCEIFVQEKITRSLFTQKIEEKIDSQK